jgi:hypothetical protein|tara:strand:+ start:2862 stop:3536 length:675 start_codon:yes stop_codon:yes gene_type:complete
MSRITWTYLELLWLVRDTKAIYSIIETSLSSQSFVLNTTHSDGRDNSRLDENVISDYLIDTFPGVLRRGEDRALGDLWIHDLPINIKVVEDRPGQANNLVGSTHFIKYIFDESTCTSRVGIANTLANTPPDRELKKYGLIIVAKNSPRVWVGNFDEIPEQHIKINPSNGIQITWPSAHVTRTNEEYQSLVTKKMVELFEKWAEPLKVFNALRSNAQGVGSVLHD